MDARTRRVIAEQLVFGYRDGHRRLAGSTELDKAAAAALLGATDANVGSRTRRLITALPLPSVDLYALCGTWPAPAGGRPGAVWAHALLVPLGHLGRLNELETLAAELRLPTVETLAEFSQPVELTGEASPSDAPADPMVLAQLLAAAVAPDGVPVVATNDLASGEASLFALWNGAWGELRAKLSFRTRERVKAAPQPGYLCVARRVTGMWRPTAAASNEYAATLAKAAWLHELLVAHEAPGRNSRDLHGFLQAFGSESPPELAELIALGELFDLVLAGVPRPVARALARDHPTADQSRTLKRALFGPTYTRWWDPPEIDVVLAVLGVRGKGFGLRDLDFFDRVRGLVAGGQAERLIRAVSGRVPKQVRALVLDAVIEEATPTLLCEALNADRVLGQEVARARPELLERPQTWSTATRDQATVLAAAVELSDRAIAAAVTAGQYAAIQPHVSLTSAALRLARAREFRALRMLIEHAPNGQAFDGDEGNELRLQLAAAGIRTAPVAELLDALEARRAQVDETWLRAAVSALVGASRKQERRALEIVFGPLHHAITDDRLPTELWDDLGKITPPADDPALRLRRLLVARARDDGWSSASLERALRDGGPYVRELKKEIDGDDDDPFVAVAKAALKTWKRLVG